MATNGNYSRDVISDDDPTGDWTRPGVFRCAPDVYRIPLPLPNDGLRAVNVYAVADGAGWTLIDSGWSLSGVPAAAGQRPSSRWAAGSRTCTGSWSPTCTATTTRRASRCAASSAAGSRSAAASSRRWR